MNWSRKEAASEETLQAPAVAEVTPSPALRRGFAPCRLSSHSLMCRMGKRGEGRWSEEGAGCHCSKYCHLFMCTSGKRSQIHAVVFVFKKQPQVVHRHFFPQNQTLTYVILINVFKLERDKRHFVLISLYFLKLLFSFCIFSCHSVVVALPER